MENKSTWFVPVLVALISTAGAVSAAYIGILPNLSRVSTNSTQELLETTRKLAAIEVRLEETKTKLESTDRDLQDSTTRLEKVSRSERLLGYRLKLALEAAKDYCVGRNRYYAELQKAKENTVTVVRINGREVRSEPTLGYCDLSKIKNANFAE